MQNKVKIHHEPLLRVAKRDTMVWWKGWLIRLVAIVAALLLCALVIVLLTGYNPIQVYVALFQGSFGTSRKVWVMLQKLAMLLCVSLAVTPAFKMKFWNIGAEGQTLMGSLATAACMIWFGNKLPIAVLIPIMLVSSMVFGMIWGLIPAFFKAKYGANETLFTLMMNYVAAQLVSYCIVFWENPIGSNTVGIINSSTEGGWLPVLFGQKYLLNILVIALIMIGMYIYLKYSKQGYEISVVGESVNTAKYIGTNVKKVILRTMAISGALCGLAGLLLVSGTDHTITTTTVGGLGFTAIMVSWLAKFNPIVMALTSFIIVFLERGAGEIAATFRLNQSVADILTGIILFFIIGSEFFISYQIHFRTEKKEGKQ